jgi:hypothetical protein
MYMQRVRTGSAHSILVFCRAFHVANFLTFLTAAQSSVCVCVAAAAVFCWPVAAPRRNSSIFAHFADRQSGSSTLATIMGSLRRRRIGDVNYLMQCRPGCGCFELRGHMASKLCGSTHQQPRRRHNSVASPPPREQNRQLRLRRFECEQ